jgi:hypothetical protein
VSAIIAVSDGSGTPQWQLVNAVPVPKGTPTKPTDPKPTDPKPSDKPILDNSALSFLSSGVAALLIALQ